MLKVVRTRSVSVAAEQTNNANSGDSSAGLLWVTFVDTPGQDIFYRMRNYGAGVADVAVLLVAVDEGVQNYPSSDSILLSFAPSCFFSSIAQRKY